MSILARSIIVAAAAGLFAATPAAADYSIVEDAAFPSVVYVEFDPSTMPKVLTAPGSTSGLPTIKGGQVDIDTDVTTQTDATGTQNDKKNDQTASNGSVDDDITKKIDDIVNATPQEMEKKVIDRAIDDRVFEGTPLVGTNG